MISYRVPFLFNSNCSLAVSALPPQSGKYMCAHCATSLCTSCEGNVDFYQTLPFLLGVIANCKNSKRRERLWRAHSTTTTQTCSYSYYSNRTLTITNYLSTYNFNFYRLFHTVHGSSMIHRHLGGEMMSSLVSSHHRRVQQKTDSYHQLPSMSVLKPMACFGWRL